LGGVIKSGAKKSSGRWPSKIVLVLVLGALRFQIEDEDEHEGRERHQERVFSHIQNSLQACTALNHTPQLATAGVSAKLAIAEIRSYGSPMSKAAQSKLIIAGAALILCLPVFGVAAGLYCRFAPREYYAETTIEFRNSNTVDLFNTFADVALPFRESANLKNVRNTSLYDIGVYDLNPQEAANRANTIAVTLQQKLGADEQLRVSGSESSPAALAWIKSQAGPAVKIWAKAMPPAAPSRPNVFIVMFLGLAPGLLLAGLGGVLVIVASDRSASGMA